MSSVSESNIAKSSQVRAATSELGFVLIFSTALFSSALLLFLVQPIIGKLLLPKLGGTPQIWTTCMVFFQAVLFAAYLHAHFTSAIVGVRKQAAIHLCLAGLALITLPIGFESVLSEPDPTHPIIWLVKALLLALGAPMFIVSATAPLLQKWVANTSHPAARDPYFMYAASNAGSLLALLTYPTLVEPFFDLRQQTVWWSGGYAALVLGLAVCLWLFHQNFRAIEVEREQTEDAVSAIDRTMRVRWLLLSFVPSSLLLGVTNYISTDIAAVPLFWVVPLALYLLTFIIVFAPKRLLSQDLALRAQAVLLALLIVTVLWPVLGLPIIAFPLHLLVFFLTALACHGELANSRPDSRHLTEFYLWLSLGGVLGGVFNALIAPIAFDRLIEYPAALVLACLLRPRAGTGTNRQRTLDVLLPLFFVCGVIFLLPAIAKLSEANAKWGLAAMLILVIAAAITALNFSNRALRLAVLVGAAYFTLFWNQQGVESRDSMLLTDRSFFGVHKVYYKDALGVTVLKHGTTVHGAQYRDPELAKEPLSYYHRNGPFGDLFRAIEPQLGARPVAVIGLGAGEIACHGRAGSEWTYYEIDPVVEQIARNPSYFTYLRDCPPKVNVVLGDARLTIRNAPEERYGLVIIDAFNSDAIPTHLLTREAIADYLSKLAPGGVLALHISNRHVALAPVVANLAANAGLAGRVKKTEVKDVLLASSAEVAVLARSDRDLGAIAADASWNALAPDPSARVWSDDYINILAALRVFH